ncbi:hypothetical protein C8Q75DRAFT_807606 [Abortiporus biennis]|nr:hypothetical protein C8Q75DRAFT_807606 [Abortiporus biennis]
MSTLQFAMEHPFTSSSDEEAPTTPTILTAAAPFDCPNADCILRTSDNVDYRVRRAILSVSSDIFEGMFSLPELGDNRKRKERDDSEYVDGLPIISVSEDSETLRALLCYCYPVEKPEIENPRCLCKVLEASKKYMFEYAETELKKQFDRLARTHPVAMYALANKRGWQEEMRVAAKCSLQQDLQVGSLISEMEDMSAGAYVRLLNYHKKCSSVAAAAVLRKSNVSTPFYHHTLPRMPVHSTYDFSWLPHSNWPWLTCQHKQGPIVVTYIGPYSYSVSAWWVSYMEDVKGLVEVKPSGDTIRRENEALFAKHLHTAISHCNQPNTCGPNIVKSLREFVDVVVKRVEDEIGKVTLEIV